jgi:hypothetical protein
MKVIVFVVRRDILGHAAMRRRTGILTRRHLGIGIRNTNGGRPDQQRPTLTTTQADLPAALQYVIVAPRIRAGVDVRCRAIRAIVSYINKSQSNHKRKSP